MANLDIIIRAQDQATGTLNKVEREIGDLDRNGRRSMGGLSAALGTGLKVAAGVGAAAVGVLAVALGDAVRTAKVQIEAEKQLNAVLTSTGFAAGLTAQQIKDMASGLQAVTNFGDEAILSGQNLLLTFTNIGADTFPRATEAMLDMSQALGQSMKSSAIQLGKALNDPILGVSALREVGVSFTEQQQEQIKVMQEAGNIAGAQVIILAELERQVGGSAKAMADPMVQLSNSFGDLKEVVGMAVVPVLNSLAKAALPLVQKGIEKMPEVLKAIRDWWDRILPSIEKFWAFMQEHVLPLLGALGKLIVDLTVFAIGNFINIINATLMPILRALWQLIDGAVVGAFGSWGGAIDAVSSKIQAAIAWVQQLRGWLAGLTSGVGGAIGGALGGLGLNAGGASGFGAGPSAGNFATQGAGISISNNVSFSGPVADPFAAYRASRDGVLSAARRIGL